MNLEELVGAVVAGADRHLGRRGVVDDAQTLASLEAPDRRRRRLGEKVRAPRDDGGDVADLADPEDRRRILVHAVVVERAARVPAGIAAPHHRVGIKIHRLPGDLHGTRRVDPHQRRLADRAAIE